MQRPLQNSPWHRPGEGGGNRDRRAGDTSTSAQSSRFWYHSQGKLIANEGRKQRKGREDKMHTSLHWPQEEISQDRNTTRTPSSRGERPREEDTWPGREEMGLGPPRRSGPQARKWSWWQNLESSLLPLAQGEGDGIPPSELKSQVPSSTLLEDRRQRSLRRLLALQAQDTATTGPGELLDQQHLTTQQSHRLEPPSSNTEGPEASRHSKAKSYLHFPSSSTTILGLQHRTIGCEKRRPPCYLYVVLIWVTAGSQL